MTFTAGFLIFIAGYVFGALVTRNAEFRRRQERLKAWSDQQIARPKPYRPAMSVGEWARAGKPSPDPKAN